MFTEGDGRRQRLFRWYSANLELFRPDAKGRFVCPICAKGFGIDAVHHASLAVDIGHAYPNELGGKVVTLECRACNGRLNRVADQELVAAVQQWESMQGRSGRPFQVWFEMEAGRVNAELTASGFYLHHGRSAPEPFAQAVKAMREQIPVSVVIRDVDRGKIDLALLHAAHLILFREFAYGYLSTAVGNAVRRVLDQAYPLDVPIFKTLQVCSGDWSAELLYRVCSCVLPTGEKVLAVCLPSIDSTSPAQFLILPGLSVGGLNEYSQLMERPDRWQDVTFRTIDGVPRQRLTQPEFRDVALWRFSGMGHFEIDMSVLLTWVRKAASKRPDVRVDLEPIAVRCGIPLSLLRDYVVHMARNGLLSRVPKKRRMFLVRLPRNGELVIKM